MANSKTIKERLSVVETKVDDLQNDVSVIKDNHLPHIQKELSDLKTEVAVEKTKLVIIVSIASMVGSAVIRLLLG